MTNYKQYKQDVMLRLNINEAQYNMNILEYSYEYLEYKGYDVDIINELHQMPGYWVWWKNQFAIADLLFLNSVAIFNSNLTTPEQYIERYRACHITIIAFPGSLVEKLNNKLNFKHYGQTV